MIPNQQQLLPSQQQQLNPALNPNYYQQPAFPTSSIFQDGQFYPTMDPQFSVQARISPGPNGNGTRPLDRLGDAHASTLLLQWSR